MSKQAFKRVRKHLKMEVSRKPLDAYDWLGGYPLYYLCADGLPLCPNCVNNEIYLIDEAMRDPHSYWKWRIIAVEVNEEDTEMICSHCSKIIESAYGED